MKRAHEFEAITRGVRVRVHPHYSAEHSNPARGEWFFLYHVTISNEAKPTVRLVSRHWVITNAHGAVQEVRGPGVVGEQPVLAEGEQFEYTSGCPLGTPFGSMRGSYQMIGSDGDQFEVEIPAFSLSQPGLVQ